MKISLRHLLYIQALCAHNNFARAADEVGISQPALSKSISALEQKLGFKLFHRSSVEVTPTEFGTHILQYCEPILQESLQMERELDLLANIEIAKLRVGFGYLASDVFLAESYSRMAKDYPAIIIRTSIEWVVELLEDLHQGNLDFVVCDTRFIEEPDKYEITELHNFPACYVCRLDHPLLREKQLTLKQLFEFPIYSHRLPLAVVQELSRLSKISFSSEEDYPKGFIEGPFHLTADIIGKTDNVGISIQPILQKHLDDGQLVRLPIETPTITTSFGFISLKRYPLSRVAHIFKNTIVEISQELKQRYTT